MRDKYKLQTQDIHPLSLVAVKDSCFTSDEIKLNTLATLEQLQTSGNKLPYGNDLQIRIILIEVQYARNGDQRINIIYCRR